MHCYTINTSVKKSGDDDVDPLKYFSTLHTSYSFFFVKFSVSVMSLM
jgi:hypothetical protein